MFIGEYRHSLDAKGRIIVSAYSSDLSRIQKIINMSVERGKRIAIIGRKAEKIVDVRNSGNIFSVEDFQQCSRLSSTVIKTLEENGVFSNLAKIF